MTLVQTIMQGRWLDENPLTTLPHLEAHEVALLGQHGIRYGFACATGEGLDV